MKVTIRESQLPLIIKETITESYQKLPLFEYAHSRKDYIMRVSGLLPQILQNWCLVHYCTLISRDTLKKHWRQELQTHLMNISQIQLKGGNSVKGLTKALREAFDLMDIFDGQENIDKLVRYKFVEEKIDTSSQEYTTTINDCYNNLDALIDSIVKCHETNNIEDYLTSI